MSFAPPESLLILDCEASGLSEDSYPISIGICGADSPWFWMITPMEDWEHWDELSEAVHGIDREQLYQFGRDAFLVAREMNAIFKGQTLYCDSTWDLKWVKRLFNDSGVKPSFEISCIESHMTEEQKYDYHVWVEESHMIHHPVQDAEKIRDYVIEHLCKSESTASPDFGPSLN